MPATLTFPLGYLSQGAGAQTRPAAEKIGDLISVLDFIPVAEHAAIFSGGSVYDASGDIRNALTHVQTNLGGGTLDFHGLQLRLDSGIEWDPEFVSLRGNGARLYFGNLTSGNAITVVNTLATTGLDRALHNAAHEMQGFQLVGPGVEEDEVVAISLDNADAPTVVSNVAISAVACQNFATDIRLGDGAFCLRCRECTFANTALTTPSTPSIDIPVGNNSGERNGFLGCTWYARDRVLDQANGNATTIFTDCSFDYGDRLMNVTGGRVRLSQCHIEGSSDVANWFHVAGNNATLSVESCELVITGLIDDSKTVFAPFYCDATALYGGIVIDNLGISQDSNFTSWATRLVAGSGRTRISNLQWYESGARPVLSGFGNRLALGGFESDGWADEWTATSLVSRVSSEFKSGAHSLEFLGDAVNQSAICRIPAKPGDWFTGELWFKSVDLTATGGTFYVRTAWVDAGGNILAGASNAALVNETTQDWTLVSMSLPPTAPTGTASVEVFVTLYGVTSGTPKGYIDDVVLNLA